MLAANEPEKFIITCVHGTWGRGFFQRMGYHSERKLKNNCSVQRHWFETGSDFQINLSEALSVKGLQAEFDYFEWSGENSILQRNTAAKALAELLRSQANRFPGRKKVVIAHSHGGNVMLRAISLLEDVSEKYYLITLATPFVQITKGKIPAFASLATEFALNALFLIVGSLGLIVGTFLLILSIVKEFSLSSGLAIAFAFLAASVAMFGSKKREKISRWFTGVMPADSELTSEVQEVCSTSAFPAKSLLLRPLLVLRGINDEATFALTTGAIGARLSRIVVGILDNLVAVTLLGTLFVFFAIIVLGVIADSLGVEWSLITWLFYLLVGMGGMIFVGFPLLITLTILLSNLFKSVFGRELLHGSVALEVISNSTPDWIGNVDIITLTNTQHTTTSLRHFLYAHPHVSCTIADWLFARDKGISPDAFNV
jgi:hypothetical protein